mmetsp:Transcript_86187/g.241057  ORF Transcript_86187/g.241057 Transcript_86187/m.241057 type:complete len:260 (+) Transcript_86187:306-1085(+)
MSPKLGSRCISTPAKLASNSNRNPKPPRLRPGPPESQRSSLRRTNSGAAASVTSTCEQRRPLGKMVALKPSRHARAPIPPPSTWIATNGGPASNLAPEGICTLSRKGPAADSAGIRSGTTWAKHPKTRSGNCAARRRPATSHRCSARIRWPFGTLTWTALADPAFWGTSRPITHVTAKRTYASVYVKGALMAPRGDSPPTTSSVRSTCMPSAAPRTQAAKRKCPSPMPKAARISLAHVTPSPSSSLPLSKAAFREASQM